MGQAFQQAPGHQQKYYSKGQPGTDGNRLDRTQSVFATAEDQRRRNGTFHDHPEYTLSRRGIGFAASGDAVDHQRAGIRRGYEEHQHQDNTDERDNAGPGQLLKHLEGRQRNLGQPFVCEHTNALLDLFQCRATETTHPYGGDQGRDNQNRSDKLTYCPAF